MSLILSVIFDAVKSTYRHGTRPLFTCHARLLTLRPAYDRRSFGRLNLRYPGRGRTQPLSPSSSVSNTTAVL
ncbi:hypothetical protein FOVSG1_007627 [Fusarium oxysporum f. sp. vasinfectum]